MKYRFVWYRFVGYSFRFVSGTWLDTNIPSKHFVYLQDVFKTSSRHVFKTPSRRLGRRKIVTLKTCWRRLHDMSWRHLQDVSKTNKCLLGIVILRVFSQNLQLDPAAIRHNRVTVKLFLAEKFSVVGNTMTWDSQKK